jgi:hypothetical protein
MSKRQVIVLAIVAIGAADVLISQVQQKLATPAQEARTARYQIVISPLTARDTWLLDTQTGKVWKRVIFTDIEGTPEIWDPQPRFDNAVDEAAWAARQPSKKAQ